MIMKNRGGGDKSLSINMPQLIFQRVESVPPSPKWAGSSCHSPTITSLLLLYIDSSAIRTPHCVWVPGIDKSL